MVNKFAILALFVSGAAFAAGQQSSITDKTVNFHSIDSAAKVAIENVYSISTEVEYAGFIVQHGDVFYITSAFTNYSDDRVNMNVRVVIPTGSKIVGYYHIHPTPHMKGSVYRKYRVGETFSRHDINFANQQNLIAYVGVVKNQTILRYDPSNELTEIIE